MIVLLDLDNNVIGKGETLEEAQNNAYYNSRAPQKYGSYIGWLQSEEYGNLRSEEM